MKKLINWFRYKILGILPKKYIHSPSLMMIDKNKSTKQNMVEIAKGYYNNQEKFCYKNIGGKTNG